MQNRIRNGVKQRQLMSREMEITYTHMYTEPFHNDCTGLGMF